MKREAPVEGFTRSDREPACHAVTCDLEFPIVLLRCVARATHRCSSRVEMTLQGPHEIGCAIHDFVCVQLQLPRIAFVRRNLNQDVLVMAGRIGHRALRLSFPGANYVLDRRPFAPDWEC